MRIALIGNCQARGIARCIEAMAPHAEVLQHQIRRFARAHPVLDPIGAWMEEIRAADVVLCVDALPKSLAVLSIPQLEATCRRLVVYPYVAFSGFQPDSVYVDGLPEDVPGPMGPYHSVIAAVGHLLGLDAGRTARLYNRYVFALLGYTTVRDRTREVAQASARALGYDLSPFFDGASPFMHTINHPDIAILAAVASQALAKAGVEHRPIDGPLPWDELAESIVWPVYPGMIAGIDGSWAFRNGNWRFDLPAFVEAEHALFARLATPVTSRTIESARTALARVVVA